MNTRIIVKLLTIALIAAGIFGCTKGQEIENTCESTKLEEPVIMNVYMKLMLENSRITGTDFFAYDASTVEFSGTVVPVSCDGTLGTNFSFNSVLNLEFMEPDSIQSGLLLDQYNEFLFSNSNDYLLIGGRLKAFLPGGKIYESEDISQRILYTEINNDPLLLVRYIKIHASSSLRWYLSGK